MKNMRSVIREAMDKTGWRDKTKAKRLAWQVVKEDADLLIECAQYGINELVDEFWRSQEVPTNAEREVTPQLTRPSRYARTVESRAREWLIDERISDGAGGSLIVRHATKRQIEEYAQKLIAIGTTTLKRGHYFRAVAELLPK